MRRPSRTARLRRRLCVVSTITFLVALVSASSGHASKAATTLVHANDGVIFIVPTPEPSSFSLLVLGGAMWFLIRRRKQTPPEVPLVGEINSNQP